MNERSLRFDAVIAVCALCISCVAALASVFQTWVFRDQTRVIHDQYAATIWPYVNIDDTTNTSGVGPAAKLSLLSISITNNGLGPALIRGANLSIDGRAVPAWNDLRDVIERAELASAHKKIAHAQMSQVDASTTIRPGDSRQVFSVALAQGIPVSRLIGHDVAIHLCYCSLNNTCWNLQYKVGQTNRTFPIPAKSCDTSQSINSSPV